jgi:hypothetical protein
MGPKKYVQGPFPVDYTTYRYYLSAAGVISRKHRMTKVVSKAPGTKRVEREANGFYYVGYDRTSYSERDSGTMGALFSSPMAPQFKLGNKSGGRKAKGSKARKSSARSEAFSW